MVDPSRASVTVAAALALCVVAAGVAWLLLPEGGSGVGEGDLGTTPESGAVTRGPVLVGRVPRERLPVERADDEAVDGVRIRGVVRGPTGDPLAGVLVRLERPWRAGNAPWHVYAARGEVRTDADGCFGFPGAPIGQYRITVPGGRNLCGASKDANANGDGEEVVLELRAHVSPRVEVVDEGGAPVPIANLMVSRFDPEHVESTYRPCALTDDAGQVILGGLDPDAEYRLVVQPPSELGLFSRTIDPWTPQDARIVLDRAYDVRGVVVDERGDSIQRATVVVVLPSGSQRQYGVDRDGRFTIGALGEGDIGLQARVCGLFGHVSSDFVTVRAGTRDVVLVVERGLELELHVRNWPEGRSVTAYLTPEDALDAPHSTLTGIVSGKGRAIVVGLRADRSYLLRIPAVEGDLCCHCPGVRAGDSPLVVDLEPGGTIRCRVVVPEGMFHHSGIWAEGCGVKVEGRRSEQGTWEFRGLPPGVWRVRVRIRGVGQGSRSVRSLVGEVEVRTGESVAGRRVTR